MAVDIPAGFSDSQRATLRAVCDTFAPSIAMADDPTGFWARSSSDLHVPEVVEMTLMKLPPEIVAALAEFLDTMAAFGFDEASAEDRERFILAYMDASEEALAGIQAFKGLTLMLYAALPDASGKNPSWALAGYPGPLSAPPATPKPIRPLRPEGGPLVLDADVVVVGSGAGGGVIAGTAAAAGKAVVVMEAGGYYNEADFNQYELWAYENLYRGGGLAGTVDGSVSLMTGANLGGGTTVNWTNCIRTRDNVRAEWAAHGLEGVDGPDFDRHLDAVWTRLGVNDECSDYNGPHQRLQAACDKLGYSFKRVTRNADRATYDPQSAGYMGFGDQSGSKLGTLKTYLEDAHEHDARFVVRCHADRILVEGGRAVGVEGTYIGADGNRARVVVNAPTVVVAAGALDSPALLRRSGIGGPAVGRYLRLHPATAVVGVYPDETRAWWGPPQSALSDQFANIGDGYGFLVECPHFNPGLTAAATPWASGRQLKELTLEAPYAAGFVLLLRDHGHGLVDVDAAGNAVHHYHLQDDAIDEANFRRGLKEIVLMHAAAGARAVYSLHTRYTRWDAGAGESIEAFSQRVHDASLAPNEHATFSLHHMGSCRMGSDPATSVAGPFGELHDVKGVWIGDGSAFPTSSGTNPMISIMALAHRTAEAILASS